MTTEDIEYSVVVSVKIAHAKTNSAAYAVRMGRK